MNAGSISRVQANVTIQGVPRDILRASCCSYEFVECPQFKKRVALGVCYKCLKFYGGRGPRAIVCRF